MASEIRALWFTRLAFIVPSVMFGAFIAAGLLFILSPHDEAPKRPDMSKYRRVIPMEDLSRRILGFAGLHTDIVVYEDTFNPSFCASASPSARTVFLSPDCSMMLSTSGKYDWHNVGMLARMIGHVLNAHYGQMADGSPQDKDWSREQREAEEFAGWALRKLGATLPEAQRSAIEKDFDGNDIPANPDALAAIERGWNAAR